MLTLRQIEVIRAIMVTGTVGGAARLLNVSSPGMPYEVAIRARFGSTVCALVSHGLGIAIVDEFMLAADQWPKIRALDIIEPTNFQTYAIHRKDAPLSSYAARFVAALRREMDGGGRPRASRRR